jgi:deoxyribonuclease V
MQPVIEHPWQLTPGEAAVLQNELRERVERNDRLPAVRHVAGVDVG